MSTPRSLALPAGALAVRMSTGRGDFAAIAGPPPHRSRGSAVLVPGFTGSKEDFLPLLEPLSKLGWQAIAFDQRGQFETPSAADEDGYSLSALGADAAAVVEFVREEFSGGPVHLLGHSFGGLVVSQAVAEGCPVETLTLLCSGPGALPAERFGSLPALHDALPAVSLERIWQVKQAQEAVQRADRADHSTPESDAAHETDEIDAFGRTRFLANDPLALRAFAHHLMSAADLTARLADRGVPVLIAYGEHDDAWPLSVQNDMAARLGTVPVVLSGAAHSPAVETPAALADLLSAVWSTQDPLSGLAGSDDTTPVHGGSVEEADANQHCGSVPLPLSSDAAAQARSAIGAAIADLCPASRHAVSTVVSELVTNAVRYGAAPLTLAWSRTPTHIRVGVRDGVTTRVPVLRADDSDVLRAGQRGMTLIAGLCENWGWERTSEAKTVWARIAVAS